MIVASIKSEKTKAEIEKELQEIDSDVNFQ